MDRHSSTAARVSQRAMISLAQTHDDCQVESRGISSAFLQGRKFDELTRNSKKPGLGDRENKTRVHHATSQRMATPTGSLEAV
eukprot:3325696-Pyramimonas_sp.AAC.1